MEGAILDPLGTPRNRLLICQRYLDAAKPTSFRGLRLGVVRQNFLDEADGRMTKSDTCIEDTEASLKSTIEVLRKEGADVVNVDMDMNFADLVDVQLAIQDSVMTMTIEEDLGKYLMDLEESPVRSLKDIVKWNDAHAVSSYLYYVDQADGVEYRIPAWTMLSTDLD